MNLTKLFEMQAQLDADIMANHPVQEGEDRFGKKVLALLVELGELGQCWRGFKYWSKDQQARTAERCVRCTGEGVGYFSGNVYTGRKEKCGICNGTGVNRSCNPLLEEYVDCLHFILSIGNDLGENKRIISSMYIGDKTLITEQFNLIFSKAGALAFEHDEQHKRLTYRILTEYVLALGKMLGFTWEQIEQAYYDKNKENFARQARGY